MMRHLSIGPVALGLALLGAVSIFVFGMMVASFMANFMGGPQTLEQSLPLIAVMLLCPVPLILVVHAGSRALRNSPIRPIVIVCAWVVILIAGAALFVISANATASSGMERAAIVGSYLFPVSFSIWLLFFRRR